MEAEPTRVEHRIGLCSNGLLLALPTSIRLGSEAYQSRASYGTLFNGMLLALPTSIRLGSEAYQSGAPYGTLC